MKAIETLRFTTLLQQMSIAFVLAILVCAFSIDPGNGVAHELAFFVLILLTSSSFWATSLILRIILYDNKLEVHVLRLYKVERFSFDAAEFNWELKGGFGAEGMRKTSLIMADNQSQLILNQKFSGWSEKQLINTLSRFKDIYPFTHDEKEG